MSRCNDTTPPKDIWDRVDHWTHKTEVPGGWLYRYQYNGVAMCFVPYPPADTPVNPGWTVVG